MKKFYYLFFLLLLGGRIFATTYSGASGNITWSFNTDDATLTLTGSGAMNNYNYQIVDEHYTTSAPWGIYSYHGMIQKVVISQGVTSIGNYAFTACSNLASITIPKSVTSIGNYAFSACSNLTSITIPKSVTSIGNYAFSACSNLTSINIPEGVTSIGSYTFANCSSLTSITIPKGVTSIRDHVFEYCSSLASITLPEGVTSIGESAFRSCSSLTSITIPEGVTSIGNEAFSGCSSLASITLPEGVTSIGESAFRSCISLTSITLPEYVTSISFNTFLNCRSLTSITLPWRLTSIGDRAFNGCDNITSITIPKGVTKIGDYAFNGCHNLTVFMKSSSPCTLGASVFTPLNSNENFKIYVPRGFSSTYQYASGWSNYANYIVDTLPDLITGTDGSIAWSLNTVTGVLTLTGSSAINNYSYLAGYQCTSAPWGPYCEMIQKIVIDQGVTSIGNYAFTACSNLTSINIPKSVTSIGHDAFSSCSSLSSITIPESVTSIGSMAFCNCRSLTSITIPRSVTNIENKAFYGCSSLISISIPKSVTSIGEYAFFDCSNLIGIILPEGIISIGDQGFSGCSRLTSIVIPESVNNIGDEVFNSCPLSKIVNLSNCDISVPANCQVYRRDNLVNFTKSSFVYSSSVPAPEYTKSLVPFTFSLLEAPSLEKNVGTYTASCKFHFSDDDLEFNATIPYTYTITPAPVTVNVASTSREYGDANPEFGYAVSGLFGNDSIDVSVTAPDCRSKVGNYSFIASTTAKNYSVVNTTGTLRITKAPLTITANNSTKVYGDANPKFTAYYQGFKNGESASVFSSLPTFSSQATVSSPVGEYAITATGGEAQNYEFQYKFGTLTVEKAPLAIAADNVNRLYFEDTPEFTFSSKGWKNGENASVLTVQPTMLCAAEKTSPAGVYDIVPSGAEAQNYDISYQNGSLTIGKRMLTVTAKDAERYYGEENPKFDYTFDGFVNDETEAVLTTKPEAVTTAEQWSDAGTYSIVMQGGEATNYAFNYVAGTLSILKVQQRIEWEQALDAIAVGSQVLLTATATSGLEVTYKYDNSMVEVYSSFDGMVLDCFKEGTVTIRATQDGNQNYHPAERVVKTINIVSTGIAPLTQEEDAAIYDLQGRKVLEAVKGFYLQDGKKVYRK